MDSNLELSLPISKNVAKEKFLCDGIVMSGGYDFGNVIKGDGLKIRCKLGHRLNLKIQILQKNHNYHKLLNETLQNNLKLSSSII